MTYYFNTEQTAELEQEYTRIILSKNGFEAYGAFQQLQKKFLAMHTRNLADTGANEPEPEQPCHKDDGAFHEKRGS